MSNIRKVHSFFLLLSATLLFGLGGPSLKFLIEKGENIGITHPNAITFCNILFVGNFCAGLLIFILMKKKGFFQRLAKLTPMMKFWLVISCILATIYPTLIFIALEHTSIPHLVLVSRFEGIAYIVLSALFMGTKITKKEFLGYGLIAIGVVIALFSGGEMFGRADVMILIACIVYAISELISIKIKQVLDVTSFLFIRNFFSAILFFAIAIYLYGPMHFNQLAHHDLWVAMLVYAAVAIVAGQLMWFKGIDHANKRWPADFSLIIPVFSILFAYLLLNEIPSYLDWFAMAIIVLGISLTKVLTYIEHRKNEQQLGVEMGLLGR